MRLIDADAIEYTHAIARSHDDGHNWNELCVTKDEIEDMPTIQPEPHWIPVTERLPEEEKDVLVTVHFLGLKQTHQNGWNEHLKESYYVDIASHICGEWSSVSDDYKIAPRRHKVIAWRELPDPWKGE